jgi:WD40 repeat protein
VAAWGTDEAVHLYDTSTGGERHRLPVGPAGHRQLAFAPDGNTLATMIGLGGRYVIRLWDVATGAERLALKPRRFIRGFVFSPDGKLLALSDGGEGKEALRLWDTATGQELRHVHTAGGDLAFSPNGKTVAAGDRYGTVTLWEAATLRQVVTLKPSVANWTSSCLSYSPDGTRLAVAGDKGLLVWDVAARKEHLRLPERKARWLAFAPDGKTLACSGQIALRLWDVTTGRQLHPRPVHESDVWSVAVAPDGKVVASTSPDDPVVRLWDAATGQPLRALPGHDSSARLCGLSPDGKLVLSGGTLDGTLRLWETATGKELRRLTVEDLGGGPRGLLDITAFRLAPDGKHLAAVSLSYRKRDHYQLNVWDVSTGKPLTRRPFAGGFDSRFTPDGTGVTVRTGKGLTIEETATGRGLVTVPGDLGRPVAFSPDGQLIAAGIHQTSELPPGLAGEGSGGYRVEGVRLAEVVTGGEVFRIEGAMDFISFAPHGRVLATADPETLRLWDVATGRQLFRRAWPEGLVRGPLRTPISSLAFLPGGRALATGMGDGTLLVWDLAPQTWPATGSARDLSRQELDARWADLAGDARQAHRAIHTLAAAPARAVPFLKDHLHPVARINAKRVGQLIADLDSDRFPVREAAARELAARGEQVEPALYKVLAGKPSVEVRKRVEALLAAPRAVPPAATLRMLRAIRALERIATPEARQILRTIATGAPAARATRDARAALERLDHRLVPTP